MNNLENMMHLLKNAKRLDNTNSESTEEVAVLLEKAIENLPELEKRAIRMKYSPENADTYESLAAEFNVSVEDVEAAHTNALRVLRNN